MRDLTRALGAERHLLRPGEEERLGAVLDAYPSRRIDQAIAEMRAASGAYLRSVLA